MIVRPRPHWFVILFVWRGSILNKILPQLAFTVILSILVVVWQGELLHWKITLTTVPFSLLGVTVAIFLSFRNSASYERFSEARRLWGRLLTDGRNLSRQASSFGLPEPAPLVRGAVAFVHLVRHQLRGSDPAVDLKRLLPEGSLAAVDGLRPTPRMLLRQLSDQLQAQARSCRLDPTLLVELDRNLSGFNEALGGCERIANTPLPFTYAVILHRTVYLYCMLLPFGLLDSIGAMTPVMVAFVAYTFFAIEAMADEIENPFGMDANDLPLDALSRDIEIAMLEILGDAELPPRLEPVNFLLN